MQKDRPDGLLIRFIEQILIYHTNFDDMIQQFKIITSSEKITVLWNLDNNFLFLYY